MEEAYCELYQQFVRLRALCLKQAAMLHRLTAALQKQQDDSVPTADVSELMSIPVQFSYEMPVYPHEKPQSAAAAAAPEPAEQCGIGRISRNFGIFTDLLADDISRLSMDLSFETKEEVKAEPKPPFSLILDSKSQEALSSDPQHPGQKKHLFGENAPHTLQMPVTDGPSLGGGNFHCQSDVALMSDVALQSHVCEFCQAVFPGNSTTRGEFLRHLYTHVT